LAVTLRIMLVFPFVWACRKTANFSTKVLWCQGEVCGATPPGVETARLDVQTSPLKGLEKRTYCLDFLL
jgi:hypothetical protein